MKEIRFLVVMILIAGFFSACVPAKKLQDEQAKSSKLTAENADLKSQLTTANTNLENLGDQINDLNDQIRKMMSDTSALGEKYRKSLASNDELNELYDQTVQQNKLLLSKSSSERLALLDSLKKIQNDLSVKQEQLDQREKKLAELQSLINRQDSATKALKAKIQQALLGFEKSDLSVEQKNGKVYVSLSEKLLFQSGKYDVDPKGKSALLKVADVLRKNPDIGITVEGHTDNVPLAGTGFMKDNWDLSVLRSTSIIRILTDADVNPKQITASGRGEYFPVQPNTTSEGKAKNRRTEIILTPNYEELAKLLGNN